MVLHLDFFKDVSQAFRSYVVVVVVVAVAQSCSSQVILAGYRRLLPFLTGTFVAFMLLRRGNFLSFLVLFSAL